MLLYFLDMMFLTSIALFCATYFKNYIGAAALTWGIYLVSGLFGIFENTPILKYFPAMIKTNMVEILQENSNTVNIVLNIVFTIVFILLFNALAIKKIRNADI